MSTSRMMSKSPSSLAKAAYKAARLALPDYGSKFSKKSFTQPQLFTILVLKSFFRTDYRGIIEILKDMSGILKIIEIENLPTYSTLWYAEKRLIKKRILILSKNKYSNELNNQDFYEALGR